MKLRNKIASGLMGGLMLTSIGGVANAAPAEAFTKTNCIAKMDYSRTFLGEPVWSCYYNFNWFEETFQGRVDGRYLSPRAILA